MNSFSFGSRPKYYQPQPVDSLQVTSSDEEEEEEEEEEYDDDENISISNQEEFVDDSNDNSNEERAITDVSSKISISSFPSAENKFIRTVNIEKWCEDTWYDVAHLPTSFEPEDAINVVANYSIIDSGNKNGKNKNKNSKDNKNVFQVHNSMLKNGKLEEVTGIATVDTNYIPKYVNDPICKVSVEFPLKSKLKYNFIQLINPWYHIQGQYWIYYVEPPASEQDVYPWAIVSDQSKRYGWILSRTKDLYESQPAEFFRARKIAESIGIDVNKMVITPHI
jgi:lipocalin